MIKKNVIDIINYINSNLLQTQIKSYFKECFIISHFTKILFLNQLISFNILKLSIPIYENMTDSIKKRFYLFVWTLCDFHYNFFVV